MGARERGGSFQAQLTVTDESTGKKQVRRMLLENANSHAAQAVAEAVKPMGSMRLLPSMKRAAT